MDIQDIPAALINQPESVNELIENLTPEIFSKLKQAVELRKWADGSMLTTEQLESALQLVILYEAKWLPEEQRTGAPLNSSCQQQEEEARPVKLKTDLGGAQ